MGKVRSLNQQIQYAITQHIAFGQSKHADKRNSQTATDNKIYSINRTEDLRETTKAFCRYMKERHPDVRMVRDIRAEHVQAYIAHKAPVWTERTAREVASRFHKLDKLVSITYRGTREFSRDIAPKYEKAHKIRDKAMGKEHFDKLRESFANSRSVGRDAIEITARCGLRVSEVACLRTQDINLERGTLYVRREGAKNGRERYVPIREQDRAFFADLRDKSLAHIGGYVCKGSGANTINKAIRREMGKITLDDGRTMAAHYVKTTEHAIRKMYATERMVEIRGAEQLEDRKAEMRAFDIVSCELGHGENRHELYKDYIK